MESPAQVSPGKRLIRVSVVMEKVAKSRPSIYKMIRDRKFPRPIPVSSRTVAWLESEVDAWIEGQVKLRDSRDGCGQ